MDLFGYNPQANLLPRDGTVHYAGPVMDADEAQRCFMTLLDTTVWKNDEAFLFGKRIVTARKVAWHGDRDYSYTYSGYTKHAMPWTPVLRTLKKLAEERAVTKFNSCLLNLYHDGNEGMAWHSDDEKSLGRNTVIASLSFGAERRFRFKHKREAGLEVSLLLEHGSLLIMKDETQSHWLHCIPKSKRITAPRINLTFRTMSVPGGDG